MFSVFFDAKLQQLQMTYLAKTHVVVVKSLFKEQFIIYGQWVGPGQFFSMESQLFEFPLLF